MAFRFRDGAPAFAGRRAGHRGTLPGPPPTSGRLLKKVEGAWPCFEKPKAPRSCERGYLASRLPSIFTMPPAHRYTSEAVAESGKPNRPGVQRLMQTPELGAGMTLGRTVTLITTLEEPAASGTTWPSGKPSL